MLDIESVRECVFDFKITKRLMSSNDSDEDAEFLCYR